MKGFSIFFSILVHEPPLQLLAQFILLYNFELFIEFTLLLFQITLDYQKNMFFFWGGRQRKRSSNSFKNIFPFSIWSPKMNLLLSEMFVLLQEDLSSSVVHSCAALVGPAEENRKLKLVQQIKNSLVKKKSKNPSQINAPHQTLGSSLLLCSDGQTVVLIR